MFLVGGGCGCNYTNEAWMGWTAKSYPVWKWIKGSCGWVWSAKLPWNWSWPLKIIMEMFSSDVQKPFGVLHTGERKVKLGPPFLQPTGTRAACGPPLPRTKHNMRKNHWKHLCWESHSNPTGWSNIHPRLLPSDKHETCYVLLKPSPIPQHKPRET